MSQDDPFTPYGDDDRTMIRRPTPGGRGRPNPVEDPTNVPLYRPGVSTPPPLPGQDLNLRGGLGAAFGANPVTAAALSLFSLVSRLRNTANHRDIPGLQQQLVGEMRGFENRILQQGVTQEHTRMASYALCSLLDETILNTPWGAQSIWAHQGLLILFHKEAWGGEKFFQIVDHLSRQPAQNLNLIELCYLCLSLGFQGKFRVSQNGLNELEKYRLELYQLIQRVRGDFERALSPRWQGLKDVRNALMKFVPLWVVGAVVGVVLLLAYLVFLFSISKVSDETLSHLAALGREKIKTAAPLPSPVIKPAVPGRQERFTVLLKDEIGKNMVEVIDDRTLRIRNSFPAGSDQVKPEFGQMLKKIAGELAAGQDRVLVTGYTDNTPIHSIRFPSNWDLSMSRAKHVADNLVDSGGLAAANVKSKGRADEDSLVPNDSPEHRALNRRVDISIQ